MTGFITGIGRQGIASVFTLLGYWAIGIPLTLFLVFYSEMGIFGIWCGATLSITFILISCYVILVKSDFSVLAMKAQERRLREIN
jgi:Na+-driven multidrug efflux pump